MMNESASSSKRTPRRKRGSATDRPFDAGVLKAAGEVAARYRVVLERERDGFLARAVEMPSIFTTAPTPNECEAKIREMLTIAVATMLEMGERPPLPVSQRRVQLNIRLSGEEKLALEEAARRAGFRGVSEFVRFAAMSMARAP